MTDQPSETAADVPWSRWPWQTCPAVTLDGYGRCRCDLRRNHDGDHRAERGTYDAVWSGDYRMVDR